MLLKLLTSTLPKSKHLFTQLTASFSSSFPLEAIKRLRQQTSAPMGECRKALDQAKGDHQRAIQWLKNKGLLSAEKRIEKDTRQGVVAAFLSPCRTQAVLMQVNCETDFVAKNSLFISFVGKLGNHILSSQSAASTPFPQVAQTDPTILTQFLKSSQPIGLFPQDKHIQSAEEQFKLLISRLQQNIRLRRVVRLQTDRNGIFGMYVHRTYEQGVGLQAGLVQIEVKAANEQQQGDSEVSQQVSASESSEDPVQSLPQEAIQTLHQFSDNIAAQLLGLPPTYLNYSDVPSQLVTQHHNRILTQLAPTLAKAPQHLHQSIVMNKLQSSFYSTCVFYSMGYVMANGKMTVGEYWQGVEKEVERGMDIRRYVVWQCK